MTDFQTRIYSATELLETNFSEPDWIIPDILPSGLNILAGKPKAGKSMFALDMSVSVTTGTTFLDKIQLERREILYLPLEDSEYRVRGRFMRMLQGNPIPANLHFAFDWPRTGNRCVEEMKRWLEEHGETKLIILDTLVNLYGGKKMGSNYQKDYAEISKLKKVADEYRISILLVHHARKGESKDLLDLVMGSTGILAAADNVLLLSRSEGDSGRSLHVNGRDVEQMNLELELDSDTGKFIYVGQAQECQMTPERREVLELLQRSSRPMKLKEIAQAVGKNGPVVRKFLTGLIEKDLVEQPGHGSYKIKTSRDESGQCGELRQSSQEPATDKESGGDNADWVADDGLIDIDLDSLEDLDQDLLNEIEEIVFGKADRVPYRSPANEEHEMAVVQ